MAKDALVFLNTTVHEEIYHSALSRLGVNDLVEISLVLQGNGLHRILNETSECHAGDIFMLQGGIPHGFFAKSENEKPTVCTLSFSPSTILEGEQAEPESDQFCCGIFRDKLPFSYAMLNAQAIQETTKLIHSIADELSARHLSWQTAIKAAPSRKKNRRET